MHAPRSLARDTWQSLALARFVKTGLRVLGLLCEPVYFTLYSLCRSSVAHGFHKRAYVFTKI